MGSGGLPPHVPDGRGSGRRRATEKHQPDHDGGDCGEDRDEFARRHRRASRDAEKKQDVAQNRSPPPAGRLVGKAPFAGRDLDPDLRIPPALDEPERHDRRDEGEHREDEPLVEPQQLRALRPGRKAHRLENGAPKNEGPADRTHGTREGEALTQSPLDRREGTPGAVVVGEETRRREIGRLG